MPGRGSGRTLAGLVLPLVPGFVACQGSTGHAARKPNVLMIVVDTLRWDRVGCYGSSRDTTPAIDRLAAEAVRFERAYSTASWTIPAVASMITGTYPSHHTATSFDRRLPGEIDTLAEILRGEGYATAGIISHSAIDSSHNFDQGFDVYLEGEARGHDHLSTPGVTEQALEQLSALAQGDAPFFLFVHYFDPHYNYLRHPEFGFAAASAGRLSGDEPMSDLRRLEGDLTEGETQLLRDLYDEEIRFTDAGIGRLVDRLARLGERDNTVVVITADHGEEFLGHGHLGHTRSLYEELVRVPLILRVPNGAPAGRVVKRPVSVVSLVPTLLDLAGVDPAPFGFQADSLIPELSGEQSGVADAVFCEVDFVPIRAGRLVPEVHKSALIEERYKLIRDEVSGLLELFDLEADPAELQDLSEKRPELVRRLVESLELAIERASSERIAPSLRAVDEAEIERLRSLGYVGDR